MKYVVVLDVDEAWLEGADSIESACEFVNGALRASYEVDAPLMVDVPFVRPLSEEIAC